MNENKTALLKIFSTVLKDRVKSEPQYQSISTEMVKHFSRKELIEIITHNFEGEVPSEFNLVEMENNELLQLIGDDFKIISYVMSRWSKEVSQLPTLQEWMHSKVHSAPEKETEENLESKSEETQLEISEHTPTTEFVSEKQDSASENSDKPNSESPKPSDASSEVKKLEEKQNFNPDSKPASEKPYFGRKQEDKKTEKSK
ncbi:hypothetical protein CHRY9390_01613 [Chryseobacterium aquaeductus]|uniref:Uncharacterized protein n=1 Tax=Chryseobacterium aquaeductus TaxID=2675056 RepID=A0A9N8MFP1_9FLAO|nr:hypothetical protein [Chryseobacterium aquaeductus]CAA7330934.1 hypothetical protein CHRY9390_01613 [Chryseobacterium potabilaquae]CAD7807115.1 hypothetical protein CHRY9390_01613 [Chryseobacterium aquaeductus]